MAVGGGGEQCIGGSGVWGDCRDGRLGGGDSRGRGGGWVWGGGKVASAANYLGPLPSKQNLASTIFIGVDWIVDGAGSRF